MFNFIFTYIYSFIFWISIFNQRIAKKQLLGKKNFPFTFQHWYKQGILSTCTPEKRALAIISLNRSILLKTDIIIPWEAKIFHIRRQGEYGSILYFRRDILACKVSSMLNPLKHSVSGANTHTQKFSAAEIHPRNLLWFFLLLLFACKLHLLF